MIICSNILKKQVLKKLLQGDKVAHNKKKKDFSDRLVL